MNTQKFLAAFFFLVILASGTIWVQAQSTAAAQATAFCKDCIWRGEAFTQEGVFQFVSGKPQLEKNVLTYKLTGTFRSAKVWREDFWDKEKRSTIAQFDEPLVSGPGATDRVIGSITLDFNKMEFSWVVFGVSRTWGAGSVPGAVGTGTFKSDIQTLGGQNPATSPSVSWKLEQPVVVQSPACANCVYKGRLSTTSFRGAKLAINLSLAPSPTIANKYVARGTVEVGTPVKGDGNCVITAQPYTVDTSSDITILPNGEYFGFVRAVSAGTQMCGTSSKPFEDDAFFIWTLNRQAMLKNPVLQNNKIQGSNLVDAKQGDQKLEWDLSLERADASQPSTTPTSTASTGFCPTCAWRGTGKGFTTLGTDTLQGMMTFEATIELQPIRSDDRTVTYDATGTINAKPILEPVQVVATECTTTAPAQTVPFKGVVTINRTTLTYTSLILALIPVQMTCKDPMFSMFGRQNGVVVLRTGNDSLPLVENGTRILNTIMERNKPPLSEWDVRIVR